MNRYEQYLDRKPRRLAYKASLIAVAMMFGARFGSDYAAVRGSTTICGLDPKGNLPA